ncbi:hypothetical protein N7517_008164 [Penicillium concentricum]|uniref:JmjC domain-containing protein n=1 Tax=Penicillium concentricum TaxID=293559 RepID=A0A9W9RWS9_9EURO|nr:uncharacterized protein N7517_008164 [Penicillium concentricum]KAJ5365278.1 hypothetical protein N7517_008164 [Penicillium concentricum]
MDPGARNFSSDLVYSSEISIATLLHGKPEHEQLDVLTDFLTRASEINERVASSISAAWQWICQNDLWSIRYESLSDYQRAIGYAKTVRPILQRHKKSELAKRSSTRTIFRHWQVPFDEALPKFTRPLSWSKHLLSLVARLSKHRNHFDSLLLLEESMKNRPERGRKKNQLMASDVQRVLETLEIPQVRLAIRGSRKSRIPSSSAQSTGTHNSPEIGSSSSNIQSEVFFRPNTHSPGVLSLDISSPQRPQTNTDRNKWQRCGCTPICLPLIALISTPEVEFDKWLLAALVNWAYKMSWGSFCSKHLTRLARFIPGADSRDRARAAVIQNLETFCSRECYTSISDHPFISTPNLCSNTELLCRYTGSADAWWRWQRDGYLHMPGFFSYMEELGVFKRARKYLDRSGTKENSNLSQNIFHSMISQIVQQDPAYYAVLVACRADQNLNFIHSPGQHQQSTVFQNEDVGFGVPIDYIRSLVQGEGTSDVQSTVIFPTCETAQKIRLVPGFHRQINSWLQSSLELKYGSAYKIFGEARDIAVQPGDLVICLPQILRWPTTFSSSNFLKLSQIGPDTRFSTVPKRLSTRYNVNSSAEAWQQPEPQFHDAERIGDEDHAAKVGRTEDNWFSASNAIGQALTGRLDWGSDRATEERNCVLGSHGATAVEFVAKSRAQVARQFHEVCDSIEQSSNMHTDTGTEVWKERHDAPESSKHQNDHPENPEVFINPLKSNSLTWNDPSLDDMVADLGPLFSEQPLSFDLP